METSHWLLIGYLAVGAVFFWCLHKARRRCEQPDPPRWARVLNQIRKDLANEFDE